MDQNSLLATIRDREDITRIGTRALIVLKLGGWADYEKKKRVPKHEVQKMPGRPIRPSGKVKWRLPGWGQDIGPPRNCFCMWTHMRYMVGTAFFFWEKKNYMEL